MSASTLLQSLLREKAWADEALVAAVMALDESAQAEARQAATRTLNHIHVVDRIWAAQLEGRAHGYEATNTKEMPALADLAAGFREMGRWFVDYASGLDAARLAEPVDFVFTDGQNGRMTREEILAHVVTHGSYHRGAVGRVLVNAGVSPPGDALTVLLHLEQPQRRSRP